MPGALPGGSIRVGSRYSSSGAVAAYSPHIVSTSRAFAIGNVTEPATTWRCIGCNLNSKFVTTPKLPLPPRAPQ